MSDSSDQVAFPLHGLPTGFASEDTYVYYVLSNFENASDTVCYDGEGISQSELDSISTIRSLSQRF